MSPPVEGLRTQKVIQIKYFVVDLKNLEPLDLELFDNLFSEVAYLNVAKFIVQEDLMFVFTAQEQHSHFFTHTQTGDLQCAGMIRVYEPYKSPKDRTIFDYSMTLERILPREASNNYKQTVIWRALGPHFKVI